MPQPPTGLASFVFVHFYEIVENRKYIMGAWLITFSFVVIRLLRRWQILFISTIRLGTECNNVLRADAWYSNEKYSNWYAVQCAKMSFYLRQSWRDPRLTFQSASGMRKMRAYVWDDIWVPDTFFRNERSSHTHDNTVDNRRLTITNDGDVWYAMK